VGHDFRYGCNAVGTIENLRAAGAARGFGVEEIEPFVFDGMRVSSTAVRERLAQSDYAGAKRLLGRPYRMSGRVVHGRGLGRTLGFPTANLRLMRRKPPVRGILAAWAYGIDPKPLMAVVSLGTRPTVDGTDMLLEVHVFDFVGDLYGQEIEVEFVAKLRDEVKFDSLDALIRQMKIDAAQARNLLAKVNSG
jgi:riboflavin kinase/FMN adenylyltransferase